MCHQEESFSGRPVSFPVCMLEIGGCRPLVQRKGIRLVAQRFRAQLLYLYGYNLF